jgi:hypothetical protein
MDNQKKYLENLREQAEKTKEKYKELFTAIGNNIISFLGAWSDLSQANTDADIARINEVYDARKKAILDSFMDEEKKAAAIKNLESEQALAVRKLQREQAISHKSIATFEAIANTAVAITKALSGAIPPWNFILAAMSAAAGAIQIATIQAQPIPLAKGFEGVVTRPTTFLVGEAGSERLSVQPVGQGGGNRVIHFHNHIYLGGQKIKEQIVELIERASREGTLKIAAKAIA